MYGEERATALRCVVVIVSVLVVVHVVECVIEKRMLKSGIGGVDYDDSW